MGTSRLRARARACLFGSLFACRRYPSCAMRSLAGEDEVELGAEASAREGHPEVEGGFPWAEPRLEGLGEVQDKVAQDLGREEPVLGDAKFKRGLELRAQ